MPAFELDTLAELMTSHGFLILAIGVGVMMAVVGIGRQLSEKSVAAERLEAMRRRRTLPVTAGSIFAATPAPKGMAAALVPEDEMERFQVVQALARAGFRGSRALWGYYLVRVGLGIGLPLCFMLLIAVAGSSYAPDWLARSLAGMSGVSMIQWLSILGGVGFFGPSFWLDSRIRSRRQAIEDAFPNMLDLLQVGVEAGMGFDQAFTKVAQEIQLASPELAEEMLIMQGEIQAGRDRDNALFGMARRTGIDEMLSFANVVMQSARFGTPLAQALTTYANEMRYAREMRAQEKANQLPVKMSAVMASLMLPALIALILTPIIIRYMATFT
ncbi:type II secretion system F family protein [Rhodovulum sp. 12E13]|uniref:type II secretion system F family protein n=1 Tax=Rhodovulum sp. 12E13 TaxID=2203891 RepID=UPI000E161BEC|nr:type II secretion system F family protein [Rhodovulum sp. 12E13]RDC71379.1 type II secretion system F family protein [Rhodovulum sp. 12E13]